MGLLRKISLGLQITSMLTYLVGFVALKTVKSRKAGISKHGKINTIGYLLGFVSLLYMAYSALRLITSRKAPAAMFIHGPLGAVTLALSTLFVTNQWSWKSIKNMRTFVALWLLSFSGGVYLFTILT